LNQKQNSFSDLINQQIINENHNILNEIVNDNKNRNNNEIKAIVITTLENDAIGKLNIVMTKQIL